MKRTIVAAFLLCFCATLDAAAAEPRIVRLSTLSQIAPANTLVTAPFKVRVEDEAGLPLAGKRVIFQVADTSCGHRVPPPTTWPNLEPYVRGKCAVGDFLDWRLATPDTDADGIATAPPMQVADYPGTFGVFAVVSGFFEVTEEKIFRVTVTAPAHLRDESGYAFVETLGEYWWQVEVTDGLNPVAGVPISFSASGTGGARANIRNPVVNTDSRGRARLTYTTGPLVGTISFTARMGEEVVTTSLEVLPGGVGVAPTVTPISGSGQSVRSGTPLAEPLVVIVRDEAGNPMPGVQIGLYQPGEPSTWLVPDWRGLHSQILVTDSAGRFAFEALAIGVAADLKVEVLARTASGMTSSTTFDVRVEGTPPHRIEVVSGADQHAVEGTDFLPIVVKVFDHHGRAVPNAVLLCWERPVGPWPDFGGAVVDLFPALISADEHGLATLRLQALWPDQWNIDFYAHSGPLLGRVALTSVSRRAPLPIAPAPTLSPVAAALSMVGAGPVLVGVRLIDHVGLPIQGRTIQFRPESNTGLVVSPAQVLTDRDGFAYTAAHGGTGPATHMVSAQWESLVASTKIIQTATAPSVQDLWWAGEQESGWGMSIAQHGETLFSVLYVYDDTGHTTWLVMPGGSWNEERTIYTGKLYRPRGTPFWMYEAPRLEVREAIGEASLHFHSTGQATLSYTIDGIRGTKSIVRQPFAPVEAPRHAGVTDMWWGGASENGWGVAVMQQHATLFILWFTYDAQGAPAWWVMPGGRWTDANTYEGRVHRPFGSAWLDRMFDSSRIQAPDLGPFRLRFEGADRLTLDYTIQGRSGSLPLTRQPF